MSTEVRALKDAIKAAAKLVPKPANPPDSPRQPDPSRGNGNERK